jgi:hypothetical protein
MVRKAMAMLALTLFLTSNVKNKVVYLKCPWVAGKKKDGQIKMIEGEEFDFPVLARRGFFII